MFKELFAENSNPITQFVRDLISYKINPKDYDKLEKKISDNNPKWYNSLPSQGAANFIGAANYKNAYNKHKKGK